MLIKLNFKLLLKLLFYLSKKMNEMVCLFILHLIPFVQNAILTNVFQLIMNHKKDN